jgi:hypothetical protein
MTPAVTGSTTEAQNPVNGAFNGSEAAVIRMASTQGPPRQPLTLNLQSAAKLQRLQRNELPISGRVRVTGANGVYGELDPIGCAAYNICYNDGTSHCSTQTVSARTVGGT